MKKLYRRLRSCRGESLVESMVSILIFTLSSVLFFTMVTSATRINQTVKESDEKLQAQRLVMEGASEGDSTVTTKNDKVTITIGADSKQYDVTVVSAADDSSLYAYYPVATPTP
jgi:type II secretory pathway pseudopilin PulG